MSVGGTGMKLVITLDLDSPSLVGDPAPWSAVARVLYGEARRLADVGHADRSLITDEGGNTIGLLAVEGRP